MKLGPSPRKFKPMGPVVGELSARQRTIVTMIAEGYTNRQIAEILEISLKTVECHRAAAMKRTGSSSLAHLVRYAMQAGWVK